MRLAGARSTDYRLMHLVPRVLQAAAAQGCHCGGVLETMAATLTGAYGAICGAHMTATMLAFARQSRMCAFVCASLQELVGHPCTTILDTVVLPPYLK